MKVKIWLLGSLLAYSFLTYSQDRIKVKTKDLYVIDEGYREVKKAMNKGDFLFLQNKAGAYAEALKYYLEAYEYNPDNADLNYKIGVCYLNSSPRAKSLEYLEDAQIYYDQIPVKLHYYLGRSYQYNYEFLKAIDEYAMYRASLTGYQQFRKQEAEIDKLIAECKSGNELLKKENNRILIKLLGGDINTEYPELGAVVTRDGSAMYFTSRRPESYRGRKIDFDDMYNEDVFVALHDGEKWGSVHNIGNSVNSKYNDAVVAISSDNKQLFLYRGKKYFGNLYVSTLRSNGKWSKPSSIFGKVNVKKTHQSSICFNAAMTKMFFTSDNGSNGRDVYTNELRGRSWKRPSRMTDVINSPYDETALYLAPDNKTLYFSSKGHNTVGGYDIFKTILENGEWSAPENLGFPMNTPGDDFLFSVSENGRFAYTSSERTGTKGHWDIYQMIFLGEEKPSLQSNEDVLLAAFTVPITESAIEEKVEIKTIILTIVMGTIRDYNTKEPLVASIDVVDNATGEKVMTIQSDSVSGEYKVPLHFDKNYGVAIRAKDYMFMSANFVTPKSKEYTEIRKDYDLQPMKIGSKIILNNTFFNSGKSSLQEASFPELDRLVNLFALYPKLKLEISGHTDNRGSMATNQRLSLSRAKAVVTYLISKGVNRGRLQAKGYNFKFPIADNSTEEGREKNRRVEVKILDI